MNMKWSAARIFVASLIFACAAAAALAQSPKDSFVIYAKAGRVNHAEGSAMVRRTADDPGKILAKSDELTNGDIVSTGANTRLEVLLSPGAYLRMADDSEFQLVSTELDDIRVILNRGSLVIETGGGPDKTKRIQVTMLSGTAVIEKAGIYRLNVEGQRSELLVIKGSTVIQPGAIEVKDGRRVSVNSGVAGAVAKFDKKAERDDLDGWSRERAQSLAKANRSLDRRAFSRALDGFRPFGFVDLNGYWVYSARFDGCFFIPFDPYSWSSPYGYGYTNGGGWNWPLVIAGGGNPNVGSNPSPHVITPLGTSPRNEMVKPPDPIPAPAPMPPTRANSQPKGP